MSKGFVIAEQGHVVPLFDPIAAGAALTSDVFYMGEWAHATIIFQYGIGSGTTIVVNECTSFAGSNATAISDFRFAHEETDGGDVLDAALARASSVTIGAGTGGVAVIEIDADELTQDYPYIQLDMTVAVSSKLLSGVAILSGGRYAEDITATAIA